MSDDQEEVWLDAALRKGEPYINDDGFTEGVLTRLPAPRTQKRSKRPFVLLGVTAVTAVGAMVVSPIRTAVTGAALDLGRISTAGQVPLGSVVLVVLIIWAAVGLTQSEA